MIKIALQMDSPSGLNPKNDTTLFLGREAQRRGDQLFFFTPQDVTQTGDAVFADVASLTLHAPDAEPHFTLGESSRMNLAEMDVLLMRQEPPFDMGYITNTFMLDRLVEQGVLVLNNPSAVRNGPEKLIPLHFPDFIPPTLVTANIAEIKKFQQQYGEIVLKPLYAFGGQGVIKVESDGGGMEAWLADMLGNSNEPVIAQQFLPEVLTEEKRVILLDGHVAAAINRVPQAGDIRANMCLGGKAEKTELTKRQQEISLAVGTACKLKGLMLVGLDLIGDSLNEVNVTCPTGLVQASELYDIHLDQQFWDVVEDILKDRPTK